MNFQFTNRNRIWFLVLIVTITLSLLIFRTEKYMFCILIIPIDILLLMYSRNIIFLENRVQVLNNFNPIKKELNFDYSEIKEVSPLTRPSGFKIKFNNGVSSEFFFTNLDELKPFYRLMIEKNVKINPKDFTYISNLVTELKRELR